MKILLLLPMVLWISACSTTNAKKSVSSGFLGCLAEEIEISHETMSSWVASCKGKDYVCSSVGDSSIQCTERRK